MAVSPVIYVVFPTAAAVLSVVLAVLAWDRRPARGATAFSVAMLAVAVWSAGYVLELTSLDPATKLFYARLSYIGIATFPVAWFVFSLAHVGEDQLVEWRPIAALTIEPVVVVALVWTHSDHDLFWTTVDTVTRDGVLLFEYTYGPAFWAHTVYAYLLILTGFFVLIEGAGRVPGRGRRQVAGLVLAAVPPVLGNLVYLLEFGPAPAGVDLTSAGFALGGVPVFVVLFRFGFLELPSAAQVRLFETIDDPVFVLDTRHRVVRCNPAAEELLGAPDSAVQGKRLTAVLPGGEDLFTPGDDRAYRDRIELNLEAGSKVYAVSLSSLYYTHQDVMGRLVILRALDPAEAAA